MTAGAKAICEAISENDLLDTVHLRWKACMNTESAKSRFDRAVWLILVVMVLLTGLLVWRVPNRTERPGQFMIFIS